MVSQFCMIAHDLEVALVEGLAAAGAAPEQQQQTVEEEGGGLAVETVDAEEAAAAAAAGSVRQGGLEGTRLGYMRDPHISQNHVTSNSCMLSRRLIIVVPDWSSNSRCTGCKV